MSDIGHRDVEWVMGAHVDMVYAAALRQVRDPGLAEDVTQGVCLLFARKGIVGREGRVAGWLLKATYFGCRAVLRAERRRKHYEEKAGRMRDAERCEEAGWEEIEGVLDGALMRLSERDREVVALRYLEGLSVREVGDLLGISEETARKRVERAVGRLRGIVEVRGVRAGSGFGAVLAAKGMVAAPAGVRAAIGSGAAGARAVGIAGKISNALMWGAGKVAVVVGMVMVMAGVVGFEMARGVGGRVEVVGATRAGAAVGDATLPARPKVMDYSGRLVDEAGRGVGGVAYRVIRWRLEGGYEEVGRGVTGADGRFRTGNIESSPWWMMPYRVVFDAPGHGYAWWIPREPRPFNSAMMTEVVLMPSERVTGVVRNERGEPVAGARVEAYVQGPREGHYPDRVQWSNVAGEVKTDGAGRFAIERLPRGARLGVRVEHPKYATYEELGQGNDLPVAAGASDVSIQMGAGATVRVQLMMDGKRLRRGGVQLAATEVERRGASCSAVTDAEGVAVIHGVAGGEWAVGPTWVKPAEGLVVLPALHVRVETGVEKEVQLSCVRGVEVRGRVVDATDGKGILTSVLLRSKDTGRALMRVNTNEEGEFSARLAPGEVEAWVQNWEKGFFKDVIEDVAVTEGMGRWCGRCIGGRCCMGG
ncbi:MAG: sigma-70 family RNA polymerase sigma factor [Phycisphaerae bacterium]